MKADEDQFRTGEQPRTAKAFQDCLAVSALVLGITLPALFLRPFVGNRSIALFYLLGVTFLAVFVGRGPTLLAAALSALAAVTVGMYFLSAVVLGQITTHIRAQEKVAQQRAGRSDELYQMARDLLGATILDQMVQAIVRQMERAFQAPIAVLLADSAGDLSYHAHPASTYDIAGPEQPIGGVLEIPALNRP